jgi:hypothetical protein
MQWNGETNDGHTTREQTGRAHAGDCTPDDKDSTTGSRCANYRSQFKDGQGDNEGDFDVEV